MKKLNYLLFSLTALVLALSSCSGDMDKPPVPGEITGLVLPSTTIQQGSVVAIQGVGFESFAKLWLRPEGVLESSDQDVEARILSMTTSGLTFAAPNVYGTQSLVMKQLGKEYILGTLLFAPKVQLNKRIIKYDFSMNNLSVFSFAYDANNKLKTLNEKMINGTTWRYSYTYNAAGQLVEVVKTGAISSNVLIDEVYEYVSATSIKLITTDYSGATTVASEEILTLNAKGQVVKLWRSDIEYTTYIYDTAGNLIARNEYVDGAMSSISYKYDANKSILSNQGLPVWYWVSKAKGNLDLFAGVNNVLEINDGTDVTAFKYAYDADGFANVCNDGFTSTKIGEFTYEVIQ